MVNLSNVQFDLLKHGLMCLLRDKYEMPADYMMWEEKRKMVAELMELLEVEQAKLTK